MLVTWPQKSQLPDGKNLLGSSILRRWPHFSQVNFWNTVPPCSMYFAADSAHSLAWVFAADQQRPLVLRRCAARALFAYAHWSRRPSGFACRLQRKAPLSAGLLSHTHFLHGA